MINNNRSISRSEGPLFWRVVIKHILTIFLPIIALSLVVTVAVLFFIHKAETVTYRSEEKQTVTFQALRINEDIAGVTTDLAILTDESMTGRLWNDAGTTDPKLLAALAQKYLLFSTLRKLYHQIRLLDEHGMEIVRVNLRNGSSFIVPAEELQSKQGRYYFDDSFFLERGEVFISPFDLNVEHGEIEQPIIPVIRFATPVFDRHGGKRGVVLLNYLGTTLLERFAGTESGTGSQAMLLNSEGYWLEGPVSEDEWGFSTTVIRKAPTAAVGVHWRCILYSRRVLFGGLTAPSSPLR